MMNVFDAYATAVEGTTEDGAQIVRYDGCNGETHAVCRNKVWLDEKGEVKFAEALPANEIGPCDGSCRNGEFSLGMFLCP